MANGHACLTINIHPKSGTEMEALQAQCEDFDPEKATRWGVFKIPAPSLLIVPHMLYAHV